jgi:hypothetical protein
LDLERASADVVVCGAGAAGCAAALAAARAGARVCLVESTPRVGGTVADCMIHTLGGLYDSAGGLLNGGLAAALAERLAEADPPARPRRMGRVWVLGVCPDAYRDVLRRWLAAEPRITILLNTRICGVKTAADGVVGLNVAQPGGTTLRLDARSVVDATGTADVVRRLDPSLLQDESRRAAGGLVLRLRGLAPGALAFPRGVGVVRELRAAADEGSLPPECGKAWIDAGVYEDEAYVKLFVPLPDDWRERADEIRREARRGGDVLLAFLRRVPGFGEARLARVGALGVRDGGRIQGEYCLTGEDVRQARKFSDAVCRCTWPIEYWDPVEGVSLEYLPDGAWYEIPLRALKVRGAPNLWAAGKCLSADQPAHASARVAGSCWAMGEAAGRAAAL